MEESFRRGIEVGDNQYGEGNQGPDKREDKYDNN